MDVDQPGLKLYVVNYTLDPVVTGGALYRNCCSTEGLAFPEAADPNAFPGPNFIFRPVTKP